MHRPRAMTKKGKSLGGQTYSNAVRNESTKGTAYTSVLPFFVGRKVPVERGEKTRQHIIDGLRDEGRLSPEDSPHPASPMLDDLASMASAAEAIPLRFYTQEELYAVDIAADLPEARNKLLEQLHKDHPVMSPPAPRKRTSKPVTESKDKPTTTKKQRRKTVTSQTTTLTEEGDRRTYSNTITVDEEEVEDSGAAFVPSSPGGEPRTLSELERWVEAADTYLHKQPTPALQAPLSPQRGFDGSALDPLQLVPPSPGSASAFSKPWMTSPSSLPPSPAAALSPSRSPSGLSPRSAQPQQHYPSFSQNPYQPAHSSMDPEALRYIMRSPFTITSPARSTPATADASGHVLFSPTKSPSRPAAAASSAPSSPSMWVDQFPPVSPTTSNSGDLTPSIPPPMSPLDISWASLSKDSSSSGGGSSIADRIRAQTRKRMRGALPVHDSTSDALMRAFVESNSGDA